MLEADYDAALSAAEKRAAKCAADLAASDAVRRTLDVRLADYEEAFASERGLRYAAEERTKAARRSRWVYAGGGAALATALAIVVAVVF